METKILSKNLNGFKFLLILSILMLGVGTAWAGSSYYTAFTATSSDTGKGLVYASGPGTSTAPANDEAYEASKGISQSGDMGGSSKTNSYYAWAKPARGYAFNGWTISGSNNGVSPTSSSTQNGVEVKVTSNVEDGTNIGTATANWKDATSVTVTYGVPVNGSYTMTYSYTVVKDGKFATEEKAYSMGESSTAASGQIKSYAGDNVTVSTDASNFEGWYNNADCTGSALSTESSYNFTVSGATSIYAKFKPATKYYGKVAASIPAVPNSMPGGGTIYISNISGTTGAAFSEESQEAKITTFNSDATPPASMNQTFYLHARPNDRRYTFRGWFDNEAGTGTALSTNEDWEYTFAVSSHTEASPTTKTVYAIFDFKLYYMQVEIEPAIQGQGMVLASETKLTNPEYGLFSSESSVLTYALRAGASGTNDVYVYAKPKYGYKLAGWYSDPECKIAASVASDGKYTATGSSIYPLDPTIIKLYAKFIEESQINVTYNNPDHKKGEYKAYALDIAEVNDEYMWSRVEIFSSVGKDDATVQSQYKTDVLILEAEAISGYGVTSWTDGSTTKTTPSQIYNTTATAAKTVGVTFGEAKPFMVKASGTYYSSFSEALAAVGNSGQITVVQNAYIPAGNYTIPSGVTLLVPFDDAYTLRTTDPTHAYAAPGTPSVYVKLTLGANAHLTVGGSISVSSTSQGNQPYGGCVYGKYGQIDMESGSTITLNSGANLYCWGYITGAGEITAKSGSKVYEDFQIACWRGGTAASSLNGNSQKVFPLAQYYIQNIEAKLHVESGATEYVWTSVSANKAAQRPNNPITLIAQSSGLFQISSGRLTKWFDAVNDRQMYEIEGNTSLGAVSMKVYITITSTEYVLPLTNNMDITIKSGTLSCSNDVAILPGASIRVDEGAKASITGDIFVYDKDEWPADGATAFNYNNVSFKKVNYTATPITNARTYANMKDALLDVNGTFETNGKFYTTAGGADICSSRGTGVVNFTGTSGTTSTTYQATQSGSSISYTAIPVTAAKLHNSDDSYTLTVSSVSGDKYIYNKNLGQWMKNPKTITWDANGGVGELTTTAYSEGSFLGELPAATKDGYDLVGWFTAAEGGTQISATTKVTATTTYYAHWTPKTYTITYKNQGESTFAGSTHIDTPNPHPTTHTFNTATTLNGATRTHYTFGGWYKTVSCTGTEVTSIPASTCKNITLYAKWTPEKYDITYKDKGNVAFSGVHGDGYPTKHTYGTATTLVNPTKENYIFDGWYTSSDCSTGQVTSLGATDYSAGITLYAKWTAVVASVTAGSTTYYKTLPEAFTAANGKNGNVTIKLLKSVDVTSATSSTPLKYNAAYTCTLDLNNYTITGTTGTVSGNPRMVQVDNNSATLIITDNSTDKGGKISMIRTGARGRYYGVQVTKGKLKVAGGTIYADNQTKWTKADDNGQRFGVDAIRLESGTSLEVTGGTIEAKSFLSARTIDADAGGATITISNGLLKATATATASNSSSCTQPNEAMEIYTAGGTTTISGGEFSSTVSKTASYNIYATDASQTITVSGGKFKVSGGTTTQNVNSATAFANMAISGGYYNIDTNLDKYIVDHYRKKTLSDTHPEYANGYRYMVDNLYTITWQLDGETVHTNEVAYGETPNYGETPTKPSDERYDYSFSGWTPQITTVTADKTYSGSFNANVHYYTITWKNYNGDELETDEGKAGNMQYGATPQYNGATTPTKVLDDKRIYTFMGWTDGENTYTPEELPKVSADKIYTAVFNMSIIATQTDAIEVKDDEVAVSTTINVSGKVTVAENKTLTTDNLIIEGSADNSWLTMSSGEILGEGTVSATNAYYDMSPVGGYHARIWYAVAVPWTVSVPKNAVGDVYDADGHQLRLNIDFDLLYYNGATRATGGTSNWNSVAKDASEEWVMKPGMAYMIYLANPTTKLRFKKSSGDILTSNVSVKKYDETTGNYGDANWNGIANPALYHAYLNAGTGEGNWGQVFVPGNAPRESGTYAPIDMSSTQLVVGQPVFVQALADKSVVAYSSNTDYASHAPRRVQQDETMPNVRYAVEIASNGKFGDRIFVLTNEDKEDVYTIGQDVAKLGSSSTKPQMWVNRYDSKLCVNTMPLTAKKATYPLSISVPADGDYELYIANEIQEGQDLYVTYNNRMIWNLTYGPFTASLSKGTHTEYGLKLVQSPMATTGLEDGATINEVNGVRKVLIDNTIYIIREGVVYTINGQQVQ